MAPTILFFLLTLQFLKKAMRYFSSTSSHDPDDVLQLFFALYFLNIDLHKTFPLATRLMTRVTKSFLLLLLLWNSFMRCDK